MALTPPIGYEDRIGMVNPSGTVNWFFQADVARMQDQGWTVPGAGGGVIDPSSPGVFYGEGSVGPVVAPVVAPAVEQIVSSPVTTGTAAFAVGGAAVAASSVVALRFSSIAARFGVGMARNVFQVVRQIVGGGRTIRTAGSSFWSRVPSWLKQVLAVMGIAEGADLIFDDDSDGGGGGPFPVPGGIPGSGMAMTPGVTVIGSWVANGITFYRLSNGYIAVQNMKGRWKVWKPKKPIVLMPSGAGDLRTLLKADRVVNNQIKKLSKIIKRRKK